jgi:hypothetical protein
VQAATSNEPQQPSGPAVFSDDDRSLVRFHSLRFKLSIPLPDGQAWRVDDHSRRELLATHAPTHSALLIYLFTEPDLMNRQKCEARARELGLVARGDLRTVEDAVTVGPEAYDTRVWVALAAGRAPGDKLAGHVFGFGAYIHKCLFFHYASDVASDHDEPLLSARLATARTRILAGIGVDPFDAPPRERPGAD